jgi:SAM-dependent methyltransferase
VSAPPGSPCCILCGAPPDRLIAAVGPRRYYACGTCGLRYLDPACHPSPDEEEARYREHRNSGDDPRYVAFLARLGDQVIARLDAGAVGVDYGCGPAPVLGRLLQDAGFPVVSYDPVFVPVALPAAHTVDFVTCSEVIEHAHTPGRLLDDMSRLLRPGGLLAVMTSFVPDDERFATWHYRRDHTHVGFYSPQALAWVARRRGWSLVIPAPNVALFRVPRSGVVSP